MSRVVEFVVFPFLEEPLCHTSSEPKKFIIYIRYQFCSLVEEELGALPNRICR